jgi:rifampicin phosphotransferase
VTRESQIMKPLAIILLLWLPFAASSQPRPAAAPPSPRWLNGVASREDFDRLARVYYQGRFYALPHLMFVVDRAAHGGQPPGRVYYVNSRRYAFHKEFVNANYLTLERGREFFRHNYLESSRRFLLGTVAYQTKADKFTFEFWEGDLVTPELVSEAHARLAATFFAPVHFKPNSAHQQSVAEKVAAQARPVPVFHAAETGESRDYVPLHRARAVGVLRVVDRMADDTIIDRNEIVIFRESPLTLTPLSGVITTNFSTPLAHVNLLAAGWGVPNAYVKGADEMFKSLVGKFVYFETREDGFVLRAAETKEAAEAGRRLAERSDLLTPPADLDYQGFVELSRQRRRHSPRFGAKAANLGEVAHAARLGKVRGVTVPPGFSVPFFYYDQFLQENKLDDEINEMLGHDRFNHDPAYRKQRLAELRARIQRGRLNDDFRRAVRAKTRALFGDLARNGVFARSSTNSEDLPNFSGAGLYTSVPNVRSDEALDEAIKTVWASLWNYEAYEARESAGLNHSAVYPSVLIQQGVNAEAAGVMITTNPFDAEDRGAVYINAKRGLGIRVVEGRRVAEQLIYSTRTGTARVLTRSGDDTMLAFDERGGVKEVKIEANRAVLTPQLTRRLAQAAVEIKRAFNGVEQDIEWLTVGNRIYIVQSRPYVRGQ